MAKIIIDYDKCDACGECADLCPMEILIIVDDRLEVQNPEDCNECEVCMDVCPNDAIRIEPE
ncbi:MAG: 4Fe-4S binding protein [Methanobacteriaceae archaeon]|nr:4Fe-4S binding protein [Methanobacteriaceae archaeon]